MNQLIMQVAIIWLCITHSIYHIIYFPQHCTEIQLHHKMATTTMCILAMACLVVVCVATPTPGGWASKISDYEQLPDVKSIRKSGVGIHSCT